MSEGLQRAADEAAATVTGETGQQPVPGEVIAGDERLGHAAETAVRGAVGMTHEDYLEQAKGAQLPVLVSAEPGHLTPWYMHHMIPGPKKPILR